MTAPLLAGGGAAVAGDGASLAKTQKTPPLSPGVFAYVATNNSLVGGWLVPHLWRMAVPIHLVAETV